MRAQVLVMLSAETWRPRTSLNLAVIISNWPFAICILGGHPKAAM
jgi:hypothetical protein